MERVLKEDPAVETYSRRTGAGLGGGLTEVNEGDFFVRLKSLLRPPIDAVMDRICERIEARVPGLEVEMALLMEDLIGDLTAAPQPIEIKLYSFILSFHNGQKDPAAKEKYPPRLRLHPFFILTC